MAMASTSNQDAWYLSLLGIAEYFRTSSPPNIKHCIQCLQAVFNFKPPPRVEARTHLQLGNILLTYTKNTDLTRTHLEQAWHLSQNIPNFDDVKFESASVLCNLYEQINQSTLSKPILRKAIELSNTNVYWHSRLIFQLSQIHASEKDYSSACSLLGFGVEYAEYSMAHYTRVLFLLSKGMLLLISKRFQEVHPLLQQASMLVEAWQGNQHQKEYLKVFFLVLQVCHYLMAGQIKSVKPSLKQLQQSIQTITQPTWPSDDELSSENIGDMFMWMPKEHLCVLVYLITAMHSMQGGYLDKAQKYTDKALIQIEKLKILEQQPILSTFQLLLLEQIIMCRLVMGNKALALQEISQACALCETHPKLLTMHKAPIHTLLGLYAMSMNCMDAAEVQFTAALRSSQERELWTFVHLNLAIVYLRTKRETEFNSILERINPETLPSASHSLRAAAYYVQGLQSFFQARYNDAKRFLRESLKMANAEDLNRLTSCSLVLLGHIFLSLGNSRESMNMVTPAMQLASKIPDVHVQLWASAILKDLYRGCQDLPRENEAYQMHCNYSQILLKDHFTASQLQEHNLIFWTDGDFPSLSNLTNSHGPPHPIPQMPMPMDIHMDHNAHNSHDSQESHSPMMPNLPSLPPTPAHLMHTPPHVGHHGPSHLSHGQHLPGGQHGSGVQQVPGGQHVLGQHLPSGQHLALNQHMSHSPHLSNASHLSHLGPHGHGLHVGNPHGSPHGSMVFPHMGQQIHMNQMQGLGHPHVLQQNPHLHPGGLPIPSSSNLLL